MTEAAPGYTPPQYVSPYGAIDIGIADRLAAWSRKFRVPNPNVPFYGGLIADLEVAVRLLNVREYIEWLQVHGDDEQRRWAAELLELADDSETLADIDRVLPAPARDDETHAEAVEALAKKAEQADEVRAVLVQVGALAPDDEATALPDLIRALVS